jgi:phosphate-selective porin
MRTVLCRRTPLAASLSLALLCAPFVAHAEESAAPAPTDAKPAETMPTEAKPAEAKPADAAPADPKPAEAKPTGTLAGYVDGTYVLGSADRSDYLLPMARLQLDGYGYAGPGVSKYQRSNGSGLKTGLFARRARIELAGCARDRWFFHLALEGGNNGIGANESNTATANVLQDAYVGYEADPLLRVTIGQFNAPFTMENFTSDKWLDFMERSLTVRSVGYPSTLNYGLMLGGEVKPGWLAYQVALMNTEGQDRPSVNNRFDVLARVVVRPLASSEGALSKLHVGASFRWGQRDTDFVEYPATTMTTPGGYAFWVPTGGKGAGATTAVPAGTQMAAAGELLLPFERFDLRAEAVYVREDRREYEGDVASSAAAPLTTARNGRFSGLSYYVMASYWPFGKPRVNGEPGTYGPPTLPKAGAASGPTDGLQLAARWEQLLLKYDSIAGGGATRGIVDAQTQDIKVNVAQAIANYWFGRRVRVSLEYSLYLFPGTPIGSNDRLGVSHAPTTPSTNQAVAPGARNGAFDFSATSYHELSARLALAL